MALSPALEQSRGYPGSGVETGGYPWDPSEFAPELQWPLNIYVYDRMRRTDTQVAATLRAITLPLLQTVWRLDPNGCRDEVVQLVSEDLQVPILGAESDLRTTRQRGRFRWKKHLRHALLALAYGHMGFEQVYAIRDGRARLARLSPRMPITIAKINVEDDGLASIRQWPKLGQTGTDGQGPEIPADRLVWYTIDQEGAQYQGVSMLRAAYKNWLLKDRLLRADAMKHERNGMGVPVYVAAQGAGPAEIEKGMAIARKFRAGEESAASIPYGANLHLKGVEGTLPDTLASIEYHDRAITRGVLEQFLDLGSTRTGSRALGDSFIDFFKLALDAFAAQFAEDATEQVIEDLVDLNWGEDEPAPQLVAPTVDVEQDLPPDALSLFAQTGLIVADDGLEEYVRGRYSLPQRDPSSPPRLISDATTLPSQTTMAARPRRREHRTRGARRPTLTAGDEPGAFRTVYQRRTQLEQAQRGKLTAAQQAVTRAVDRRGIVDDVLATGPVAAAANPSDSTPSVMDALIAEQATMQQLRQAMTGRPGDYLRGVYADSLTSGQATGATAARLLLDEAQGAAIPDWDVEFTQMLTNLQRIGSTDATVDQWIGQHLDAQARNVGSSLARLIADGAGRGELEQAVTDVLDDTDLTGFFLDHAIATAIGQGSRDLYASEGVAAVDFLTAGDARVDQECDDAESNGPYPPALAPLPPLHGLCRCALAPADEIATAAPADLAAAE